MLKLFKYLYLANLYKRAKKSFLMLFIYLLCLMLTVFIINDIISVTTTSSVYLFILIKWAVTIALLVLIGLSLIKIIETALHPMRDEQNPIKKDSKKERILTKEKLRSKSDVIMQKYKKVQGE